MRWQKAILLAGIAAGTIFHGGLYAEAAEAPQAAAVASVQGIEQVTAISKSYGDGELPAYVVLNRRTGCRPLHAVRLQGSGDGLRDVLQPLPAEGL